MQGAGWRRVDPTAAVAPERVERGLEATFAGAELLPGAFARDSPFLWQARMVWDSLNARWNDWVVQFDRATQEDLLVSMGFEDPDWRAFASAIGIGLVIAMGLLVAWRVFPMMARPLFSFVLRLVHPDLSYG